MPRLNTAKALGVARVFENPTISVKSGEAATIRSGSKVYVPGQNAFGAVSLGGGDNGKPLETGVTLNVTPTVDDRDFVDMNVSVDVAKLGSAPKAGAFLVNDSSVKTSQYVRSGETIAIGGVIRSAFSDVKDSPPDAPFSFQPLGDSGPTATNAFGNIFQVFKSRSTTQDRSMFIVFITPDVLVSPRDAGRLIRETMNLESVDSGRVGGPEDFE